MTSSVPIPRPALLRGPDGVVRSTVTHPSSLTVDETALTKERKKSRKKAREKPADEIVELIVRLEKRDRKRLRRKAQTYGWTTQEAAAHVLRAWTDQ